MHKNRWQILVLILWAIVLISFARFVDSIEMPEAEAVPEPHPDELAAAPDHVELWFLAKDIYINGEHINNYELEHPLYLLGGDGGQLVFPLDDAWRTCLGFEISIIRADKLVLLRDTESGPADLETGELVCNLEDSEADLERDYLVMLTDDIPGEAGKTHEERAKEEAESLRAEWYLSKMPWLENLPFGLSERIDAAELLGFSRVGIEREVIHERASFLQSADCVYLPFEWFTDSKVFGWSVWRDEVSGVYISTDPSVPAESLYNASNASYIEGLAAYMRSWNRSLDYYRSLYYEYIFRHEAFVSGVDQTFLMAVSRGEGMFREDVIGGGAVGLMQIMPRTGARYGYPYEVLFDPHKNVEFGAYYIAWFLKSYGGDVITAMSAYNAGPANVAAGNYRTDYAERQLLHQSNLIAWLESRGYSTEFITGESGEQPGAGE